MSPRLPSGRVREVLTSGRRTIGDLVVAFAAPGTGQVAFVAGRKVGKAVQRNRARRLLKAAWREVPVEAQTGSDLVFVARKAVLGAKSQQVAAEIADLLRRSRGVSA